MPFVLVHSHGLLVLVLSWLLFTLRPDIGKSGAVKMKDEETIFDWIKFIVGVILFVGLIAVHVWVKDLPVYVFGLPAALWGIDLASAFGRKK